MCPHTTTCVSSYYCICVLILGHTYHYSWQNRALLHTAGPPTSQQNLPRNFSCIFFPPIYLAESSPPSRLAHQPQLDSLQNLPRYFSCAIYIYIYIYLAESSPPSRPAHQPHYKKSPALFFLHFFLNIYIPGRIEPSFAAGPPTLTRLTTKSPALFFFNVNPIPTLPPSPPHTTPL
jgi:hypothetical protein